MMCDIFYVDFYEVFECDVQIDGLYNVWCVCFKFYWWVIVDYGILCDFFDYVVIVNKWVYFIYLFMFDIDCVRV